MPVSITDDSNINIAALPSSIVGNTLLNPYINQLADGFMNILESRPTKKGCCESLENSTTINNNKIKEEKTMFENMGMSNMFNGIFGRIAPDMCRLTMSGKIAIKTSSGYKAYDVKKNRLTNCDNFVFDVGEDMFFVIPTNNVQRGDIILASGKPRCVLEVGKDEIKTFCYEDSTISSIVKERHVFMNKQYLYGKIVSMFGNFGKDDSGMNRMMKYMMMSQMIKGSRRADRNDTDWAGIMPMMFMMNGGNFFDGMFDFGNQDEDNDETGESEDISE